MRKYHRHWLCIDSVFLAGLGPYTPGAYGKNYVGRRFLIFEDLGHLGLMALVLYLSHIKTKLPPTPKMYQISTISERRKYLLDLLGGGGRSRSYRQGLVLM